jgi:hypothetical protein
VVLSTTKTFGLVRRIVLRYGSMTCIWTIRLGDPLGQNNLSCFVVFTNRTSPVRLAEAVFLGNSLNGRNGSYEMRADIEQSFEWIHLIN